MTKIFIERHGESIGNRENIYLGHTDWGLTDKGQQEARLTAEHLKNECFTAIYSSDLKRAYETALPHAKIRGLEVIRRAELREMFVGDWEARNIEELKAECYEDFVIRRTHRDFVYPNGEGALEAARRFNSEILRIGQETEGGTVLVVSHSAVIRAFWYNLCGYTEVNMSDRVKFMVNASYSTLEYRNGILIPLEHAINEHLIK